jgi:23S rRNA (cytidine1920-2'-O)/16S rRNA (cytidine1409-2'-O)-methyltransferase
MTKQRLDVLVVNRKLAESREKARAMIMAGEVLVNQQPMTKPGTPVDENALIETLARPRFVSRGGDKLDGALSSFDFNPAARVCADVGASTGGFTDCLLQHGATKVYAIDVGYGILDYRLRQDTRVIVLERTNARYLESLAEPVSLVVIDAAFISLKLLLPPIRGWLLPEADCLALIKPQFEAGKGDVGKGGVVRDPAIHERVIREIIAASRDLGFVVRGLSRSVLYGPAGNTEFFIWLGWREPSASIPPDYALPDATLEEQVRGIVASPSA